MSAHEQITSGMPVYGSDGQLVGTVLTVHGDAVVATVEIDCDGGRCRVPMTAVDRVTDARVMLPNPADWYRSQPHARAERADRAASAESAPLPPTVDELPGGSHDTRL
ncbi:MAG: DUF2171 domain-containing protein [Chloroflexi bacterium]|nr:DUF2171 domain-containing protein [Chloroflexota bacterium]